MASDRMKHCSRCGTPFKPVGGQRYCGPACAGQAKAESLAAAQERFDEKGMHPCGHDGCTTQVTRNAPYCRRHTAAHLDSPQKPCAGCGKEFKPNSTARRWCLPCSEERAAVRQKKRDHDRRDPDSDRYEDPQSLGRTCTLCPTNRPDQPPNPISNRNTSGWCQWCSPKRRALRLSAGQVPPAMAAAVHARAMKNLATYREETDDFGRPLIDWMIAEDLGFTEAAAILDLHPVHLPMLARTSLRKGYSVTTATISRLCRALGARSALGWSEAQWEAHFLATRPHTCGDARQGNWVTIDVAGIQSDDAFVCRLRDAIVEQGIQRKDAARIARVSAERVSMWVGLQGEPRRPHLHELAGVARLLIGSDASTEEIEESMLWIAQTTNLPDISSPGLLILRHLWELGHPVRWLRSQRLGDSAGINRLIQEGIATRGMQEKMAKFPTLDESERAELLRRTTNPPPRDEERRQTTMRRNRSLKGGRKVGQVLGPPIAARVAAEKRHAVITAAYWTLFRELGGPPSQTLVALRAGADSRTVKKVLVTILDKS